jgi:hypothetical protein
MRRPGSRHNRPDYAISKLNFVLGSMAVVCMGSRDPRESAAQRIGCNCRKFATKNVAESEFCTAKFVRFVFFCAARSISCRRHERHACPYAQIWRASAQPAADAPRFMLAFCPSTREAHAVDLALKLNVLAVCAVFAFVGAILLGAF